MRRLAVLLVLPACFGKGKSGSVTGTLTTGAIVTRDAPAEAAGDGMPVVERGVAGPRETMTGVELRAITAGAIDDLAIPNAYGFAVRQVGEGVQTSLQTGWMLASRLGGATVFARLMFDLLSWTKLHDEVTLSALSPTFDVGIAPFGHGICVSASATWDVRNNEPDRGLAGVFVGLCGGALKY